MASINILVYDSDIIGKGERKRTHCTYHLVRDDPK